MARNTSILFLAAGLMLAGTPMTQAQGGCSAKYRKTSKLLRRTSIGPASPRKDIRLRSRANVPSRGSFATMRDAPKRGQLPGLRTRHVAAKAGGTLIALCQRAPATLTQPVTSPSLALPALR